VDRLFQGVALAFRENTQVDRPELDLGRIKNLRRLEHKGLLAAIKANGLDALQENHESVEKSLLRAAGKGDAGLRYANPIGVFGRNRLVRLHLAVPGGEAIAAAGDEGQRGAAAGEALPQIDQPPGGFRAGGEG